MSAVELPLDHHDRCPDCHRPIAVVTVDQPSLIDGPALRTRLRSCICGWSTSTLKEAT